MHPWSPSAAAARASFRFAVSPANRSPCKVILPSGGAGRSVQIASIGFDSTATSSAPAACVALPRRLTWSRGVQPGIVAEPRPRAKICFEPILRTRLGPSHRFENRKIDLILDRQAVAAIDKDRGASFKHNGKPRRTGETGKPGEALLASGDIFVLVLVRPGNQEIRPTRGERARPAMPRSCSRLARDPPDPRRIDRDFRTSGQGRTSPPPPQQARRFGEGELQVEFADL